ncbi:MAG: hypothetical protein A2W93_14490 [Bacteroidetes bacterium GWF2_43_63]|nr:MAG: hypothetical protein A2W94_01060 [Bacteroidetes bacterium GWE2_42_42]OFY52549.1 MAG: hypothetical protein A2W93_14490 [Bacteroidetes bacterium GWF2_43_63]HBG71457.1 hypothetical protein [Bacteroidales bacterium]HCB60791.1 hypothetical protein [Bacteroidales bacterium]HCY23484.1 hypothetical protein [Bacteroidales bacterium]
MEAKQRMELLLKELGLTPLLLANKLGYNRAQIIMFVLSGRNGISRSLATKIVAKFPNINYDWLRSGTGTMKGKSIASPVLNYDMVLSNRVDADTITSLLNITEYELCKRVGLSQSQMRKLSGDTLIKIAQVFPSLNPEWLIGMSTEPIRKECERCDEKDRMINSLLELIDTYKQKLADVKQELATTNRKTGTSK